MIFFSRLSYTFKILVLALITFSSAIYVVYYHKFPYELISYGYKYLKFSVFSTDVGASNKIIVDKQQISDLMTIRVAEDVPKRRELMRRFIWKGQSSKDFNLVVTPMETPAMFKASVIASTKLVLDMPYGFTSVMKLYESPERRGRLIIFQNGHNTLSKSNIQYLIKNGFDVLDVNLPMLGDNSNPTILLNNIGRVKFSIHDQLKHLESDSFNPLVLFIAPLAKAMDYLISVRGYKNIGLIGVSGGAPVVTVYGALDDRIKCTFAVAGIAPTFLRFAVPKTYWGEYEQTLPGLTRILTDLDIYILAAYGQSRQYIQIYNQHDSCCFPGAEFKTYSGEVSGRVRQMGYGSYDVFLDTKNLGHGLSEDMLIYLKDKVLKEIFSTKAEHGAR
jgi:pimeloyl-ACP methyl ester carboxylesterase